MDLKYSKTNFKLLLPYLEDVESNNGICHFKSYLYKERVLVIKRLIDYEYSMSYEEDRSIEAVFSVNYDNKQIIPIRYFNDNLNVLDNSNYWKTTFECFFEGKSNMPNVNALVEVDLLLSQWISDLSKNGYMSSRIVRASVSTPLFKTKAVVKVPSEERYSREISFDNAEHTLFICKGTISCKRKNHRILPATGMLVSLQQESVLINVNYCDSCKKYFISLDEYKNYQKKYGNLLGNFTFEDSEASNENGFEGMAAKSVLNLCGYNVNMDDDIPEWERHLILENIMVHNIVSKPKIIEYLNLFISSRKNMVNMDSAIQKWTDDLEWVRQYNIDNQRSFLVTEIKRFR